MPENECLCAKCARIQRTCCQQREIYASPADVRRIADYTGLTDFHHFQSPRDPSYLDQDDDPTWLDCVFRPDGTRRVLKQQPSGDCLFLGPQGCTLPMEVRPVVCRLYPYDYNEEGILPELTHMCPVALLPPGQSLLAALDMRLADARRWHAQLYREIRLEPHRHSEAGTPVLASR